MAPTLLCAAALLVASAAPTETPRLPDGSSSARYELEVLGTTVAHPELHVHPLEKTKSGRAVRKISFKSGMVERIKRLYPAEMNMVALLDAATYTPITAIYDIERKKQRRKARLEFRGARLVADMSLDGVAKKVEDTFEAGMVDTMSGITRVSALGLAPGQVGMVPHHSGKHRYRMWYHAEDYEDVTTPAGTFRSLKVGFALYRWDDGGPAEVGDRPKDQEPWRTWTVWMMDDAWRTWTRLEAEVDVLGKIVMELSARRLR